VTLTLLPQDFESVLRSIRLGASAHGHGQRQILLAVLDRDGDCIALLGTIAVTGNSAATCGNRLAS